MTRTLGQAFARGFLGNAPDWYKLTIVAFLVVNPILMLWAGPTVTATATTVSASRKADSSADTPQKSRASISRVRTLRIRRVKM